MEKETVSAAEQLERAEAYKAEGNMAGLADMMGCGEDYYFQGAHWRGRADIDLFIDSLRKAAEKEKR